MNGNSTNQINYDHENLFGMRKVTYWEMYGVKRFPFRGRRKYTSLLYQSLDGGMVISNDIFGLTIRQFERMFKACLDRRKTQEQWITNIRYPDKSSNDYLEYLQNCTDCNTGHLLWFENDPREKCLYEHLVKTIGSEIDIRKRQRLFIIQDMIINSSVLTNLTHISSGSLAEGLDLPGSDIDIMYVVHNLDIKVPTHLALSCAMETDIEHPGFTRLRIVPKHDGKFLIETRFHCPPGTYTGTPFYLSVKGFLNNFMEILPNMQGVIHGPCISNKEKTVDIAACLHSKYLPDNAIPWATRHRLQWPPNFVIGKIIKCGCLLVPIGPKTLSYDDILWRVSFSVAEKILVHSFNFTQFLCYGLLKLTLKRIVNTKDEVKDLLCSYFLKTALFWVSEEVDLETFQLSKIYHCFSLCFEKLILWVSTCYCPNYFIPEHNMLLGKINQSNNKILLVILESIRCRGIYGLIQNVFPLDNEHNCLSSTKSKYSFIMLDFLLYRITSPLMDAIPEDISSCNKTLSCIESLLKSESSTFIIDACKLYKNNISLKIAQLLPPPNTICNTYNIRKCYHTHFQHIIKTDAVSGWLLYASFYYVTGHFNETLRITYYVLSRYSPCATFIDSEVYSDKVKNNYRHNVHSSMTFKKQAGNSHSASCPLQTALVINTRRTTAGVKYNYPRSVNTESYALTILGVCFEISGDKDMAYQCFDEALQCDRYVCTSAESRRSKLFAI
ncbi:unnamed protein product [Mytilus coruscus]|uniref:Mab-21-like HhH/H2TH-like domain-containing protein n=1 Tax=Mytilus coruscus TaxID=42192 RepID=A0A6J8D5L4_MYTCO|nr:unnamed protein product [Mytilus coruscus]